MARFDVYANPGNHAKTTPYLLNAHSNLLDSLDSRMVIPPTQPFGSGAQTAHTGG